mgnify:CR=1 FL=1
MEPQIGFNIAVALAGGLGGWILKAIWESMRDLQIADKELTSKVQAIELLVAGQYVTREEMNSFIQAIFRKLESIEMKIDRKVDK